MAGTWRRTHPGTQKGGDPLNAKKTDPGRGPSEANPEARRSARAAPTEGHEEIRITGIPPLDAALYMARQHGSAEILVLADGRLPIEALQHIPKQIPIICGVADEQLIPYYTDAGILAILSPGRFTSSTARVQYAIFRARAAGLLPQTGHVICVSAPAGSKQLNNITDIDLEKEAAEASEVERALAVHGGRIDVLTTLLDVAIEIGAYGFEGKPVGTLFIYGDEGRVRRHTRQLTFNPYHGYADRSRNIALPDVQESLKIFARMDGAIVVERDGTVAAAGRYVVVPPGEVPIVKGKGTRHQAAAFISRETKALAVVVSETGGRVSLFSEGKLVFDLSPRSVR
jgi:DNA integrity scanning protein DisA with diadenylate cyclase activity